MAATTAAFSHIPQVEKLHFSLGASLNGICQDFRRIAAGVRFGEREREDPLCEQKWFEQAWIKVSKGVLTDESPLPDLAWPTRATSPLGFLECFLSSAKPLLLAGV